jgi:CHASE2 domain-containing sensor protein
MATFPLKNFTSKVLAIAFGAGLIVCVMLNLRMLNLLFLEDRVEAFAVQYMSNFVRPRVFDKKIRIVVIGNDPHKGEAPSGNLTKEHRKFFADVITAMTKGQAKVVAFDVAPDGPSEFDSAIGQAIANARSVGLKVIFAVDGYDNGQTDPIIEKEFNQPGWGTIGVGGYKTGPIRTIRLAENKTASDSSGKPSPITVPSLPLKIVMESTEPSLAPELQEHLSRLLLYSDNSKQKLVKTIPLVADTDLIIDQASESELQLARFTAQSIYDDGKDKDTLIRKYKDAIVLVGYEHKDEWPVAPFGKRLGVEIHATAVSNILNDVYVHRLALIYSYLIVLVMAVVAALMYTRFGKWLDYKVEFPLPWTQTKLPVPIGLIIVAAVICSLPF